jgi:hypothetical protein
MNAIILPLLGAAAMAAIAPDLGLRAVTVILGVLVLMQGTGLLALKVFRQTAEPFAGLVLGCVTIGHALLFGDILAPGLQIPIAAAFVVPAALGFALMGRELGSAPRLLTAGLAFLAGAYTVGWSFDIAPRMREFHATGRFSFWVDGIVHAGNLAQFSAPAEVGRGMVLLADVPRPLYHFASYTPAALLPPLAGVSALDATMLTWLPLGILVMACGAIALSLALEGPWLAAFSVFALAAIPDPARFGRGNAWLCFDWLLETGPGTAYSLGLACVALAMLVRWMYDQRLVTLSLALVATASCLLIRFNTFLWLAPTVALGCVAGWRRLKVRTRRSLIVVGLIVLILAMIFASWASLRGDVYTFLFGYVENVQAYLGPIDFDGLYPWLAPKFGRVGTGLVCLGLAILETAGWWLPLYGGLIWTLSRRGRLESADRLPALLLAVAVVSMLLAPIARNGDPTEFRHRAGPLLVVVLAIWSLRLAKVASGLLAGPRMTARGQIAIISAGIVSMFVLVITISDAKRPRMLWSNRAYDLKVPQELVRLAQSLSDWPTTKARFAMARQPLDSREIDDAARLVALSGVPAYVSCPTVLLTIGGAIGDETRRRLAVIDRLDHEPNLEMLRKVMRDEGISAYVVSSASDAPFDPERLSANGRAGNYAVYLAPPLSAQK